MAVVVEGGRGAFFVGFVFHFFSIRKIDKNKNGVDIFLLCEDLNALCSFVMFHADTSSLGAVQVDKTVFFFFFFLKYGFTPFTAIASKRKLEK